MSMRTAFAGLLIAALAIAAGWIWVGRVESLADRSAQAMAVYQSGTLAFTTGEGETVAVPQADRCKFYEKPPSRACVAFYADGDEVLVSYDSANPARTWFGSTAPGGYAPTLLLWSGVAAGIFSLLWLWFTSPCYKRLRPPAAAGERSPAAED